MINYFIDQSLNIFSPEFFFFYISFAMITHVFVWVSKG